MINLTSVVDCLSFTGSSWVGHTVLHAAADRLIPAHMELGGKGAVVVFDDVDMESTVDWIMLGIFLCAGQSCSATSRLIIDARIEEELLARLANEANKLRMGDPLDEKTNLGPLTSPGEWHCVCVNDYLSVVRTATGRFRVCGPC